ncbi:MAG: hypothetical protein KC503_19045 [Myxococcales bacterium]|nr:hypothetical protein [Myxococcales bacterium]
MARLFTRELIEQSIDACNSDPAHLERAKLLTGKVILLCTNTPDGNDARATYEFKAGRCVNWDFEEQPAPSEMRDEKFTPIKDGIARITATYDMFAQLDRGDIDPAGALNSPDYKIDGNMIMLLPLMQAVNSWTEKVREIEKTY